jgi:hypothetical protein
MRSSYELELERMRKGSVKSQEIQKVEDLVNSSIVFRKIEKYKPQEFEGKHAYKTSQASSGKNTKKEPRISLMLPDGKQFKSIDKPKSYKQISFKEISESDLESQVKKMSHFIDFKTAIQSPRERDRSFRSHSF